MAANFAQRVGAGSGSNLSRLIEGAVSEGAVRDRRRRSVCGGGLGLVPRREAPPRPPNRSFSSPK